MLLLVLTLQREEVDQNWREDSKGGGGGGGGGLFEGRSKEVKLLPVFIYTLTETFPQVID